jgi:hypothetical protein
VWVDSRKTANCAEVFLVIGSLDSACAIFLDTSLIIDAS